MPTTRPGSCGATSQPWHSIRLRSTIVCDQWWPRSFDAGVDPPTTRCGGQRREHLASNLDSSRSRSRLMSFGLSEPRGNCWRRRDVPAHERAQVWDLRWVAGFSIARLFAIGGGDDVLEQLAQWLRHERKSVRELAQQAVVIMAELKMSAVRAEAGGGQHGTPAAPTSRERWPVALALSVENPPLTGRIAGLIRTVLGSGPAGEVLIKDIGSWWELG